MAENDSIVGKLREQIEDKYRNALLALETLTTYLEEATPGSPSQQKEIGKVAGSAESNGERLSAPPTRVDVVMGAIATEFKSVEQMVAELELDSLAIRAVLYSKTVKSKLVRRKRNKRWQFKRKPTGPPIETPKPTRSVASIVKEALRHHPQGLTAGQVGAVIEADVAAINGAKNAIGSALYNMKKRGHASYDEETAVYVSIRKAS